MSQIPEVIVKMMQVRFENLILLEGLQVPPRAVVLPYFSLILLT